jgi:hypothetical protein
VSRWGRNSGIEPSGGLLARARNRLKPRIRMHLGLLMEVRHEPSRNLTRTYVLVHNKANGELKGHRIFRELVSRWQAPFLGSEVGSLSNY